MLKPRFNSSKLKAEIQKRVGQINLAILTRLQLVGETFVANARSKAADIYFVEVNGRKTAKHKYGPRPKLITESTPGFIDHTSNLRSSIAYIILKNGKTIQENYEVSGTGSKGVQSAKALIREIKAKFNTGYVLVVVAGMNYAAAVESRGFDVITGSSKIAEAELRAALEKIKKINKK
ncbi:hypothetical protein ACFOWA_13230 [Pedobacter lithocola]|uniref:Dinitrogenase iron-molybdenum cofactor n=1 Tax=Pedobacter lithocola TaxID=1908239 RepID=A0ABV8PDE9_9SPHI